MKCVSEGEAEATRYVAFVLVGSEPEGSMLG